MKERDANDFGEEPLADGNVGKYPSKFDIPTLQDRRYVWVARWLAVVAAVEGLAIVSLGFALMMLMPLKEIRPFLVQFAQESDVVATVYPITTEMSGFEALTQALAREYVIKRHAIVASDAEMERRWGRDGFIRLTSTEDGYKNFINGVLREDFQAIRKAGATREIKVNGVSRLPNSNKGIFSLHVDFDVIEKAADGSVLRQVGAFATVDAEYRPKQIPLEYRFINPTGFTVVAYGYEEKSKTQQKAPQK